MTGFRNRLLLDKKCKKLLFLLKNTESAQLWILCMWLCTVWTCIVLSVIFRVARATSLASMKRPGSPRWGIGRSSSSSWSAPCCQPWQSTHTTPGSTQSGSSWRKVTMWLRCVEPSRKHKPSSSASSTCRHPPPPNWCEVRGAPCQPGRSVVPHAHQRERHPHRHCSGNDGLCLPATPGQVRVHDAFLHPHYLGGPGAVRAQHHGPSRHSWGQTFPEWAYGKNLTEYEMFTYYKY